MLRLSWRTLTIRFIWPVHLADDRRTPNLLVRNSDSEHVVPLLLSLLVNYFFSYLIGWWCDGGGATVQRLHLTRAFPVV